MFPSRGSPLGKIRSATDGIEDNCAECDALLCCGANYASMIVRARMINASETVDQVDARTALGLGGRAALPGQVNSSTPASGA
jgi:hypothetical protein